MIVRLKEGNNYIEVDTDFSDEIVDTFEKENNITENNKGTHEIENTIEINLEKKNEINGNWKNIKRFIWK